MVFSPVGKTLASVEKGMRPIHLWDVATGKERATLQTHAVIGVLSLAFSPDGKMLASGSLDRTVKLWDVQAGKERTSLPNAGWAVSVAFSPDGKVLAVGGGTDQGGTVKLWDVPAAKQGDK